MFGMEPIYVLKDQLDIFLVTYGAVDPIYG